VLSEGDKQLLAELARHQGWPILKRLLQARREQDVRRYGQKMLFGKEDVPARETARVGGFYNGCDWLVQQADKAFSDVYMKEQE
jgi:hypothetical protein